MGQDDILTIFILAVVLVVGVIVGILTAKERRLSRRGESVCIYCKTAAPRISQNTYLFLIPVFFGDVYQDAEKYLLSHMKPIGSTEQIPTGMRACYVEVYQCPQCGRRHVVVKDFLRVRSEDSIKQIYQFSYESFRPMLDAWEQSILQIK